MCKELCKQQEWTRLEPCLSAGMYINTHVCTEIHTYNTQETRKHHKTHTHTHTVSPMKARTACRPTSQGPGSSKAWDNTRISGRTDSALCTSMPSTVLQPRTQLCGRQAPGRKFFKLRNLSTNKLQLHHLTPGDPCGEA